MSVTAVIPVREFDKYMPGKNLLPFATGTLLSHKVNVISKVTEIDNIIVYTESDELAEHVAEFAKVVVVRRPPELSDPDVVFNDLVRDVMSRINEATIVWAHATCPLVDDMDFTLGLNAYRAAKKEGYDSLVTVRPVKRHILDANGPLNFRRHSASRSKQLVPALYSVIGAFSIAGSDQMAEWGYNWGRSPFLHELPATKAVDICTIDDYSVALALFGLNS